MDFRTNEGFNAFYPFPKTSNEGGLKCELKTFEAHYNSKGEKVLLSVGSRKNFDARDHVAPDSALVLTKFYNKAKEVDYTEMEIRSPHLKKAFKEVIPEYKDLNVQTNSIILRDGIQYFFYYRTELHEYGCNLEDHVAIEHLIFALTYMYRTLESELHTFYNFVEVPFSVPSIDFVNLWMVFRPGDYCYTKVGEVESVTKIRHISHSGSFSPGSRWSICGERISYDGRDFGYANHSMAIRSYDGYKPLIDLPAKPLNYHPDKNSIIERMVQRGKKYISLDGIHHREYDGTAEALGANRQVTYVGEEDEFPLQAMTVCIEETLRSSNKLI